MKVLPTEPPHYHICVLDDAELELLTRARAWAAWSDDFLRALSALGLDEATYNALARSVERYPSAFTGAEGLPMTFENWADAVRWGWWRAPGVGPVTLRRVAASLDTVSSET